MKVKGQGVLQVYMDMTQTISLERIFQSILDTEIERIGHKDYTRRASTWIASAVQRHGKITIFVIGSGRPLLARVN